MVTASCFLVENEATAREVVHISSLDECTTPTGTTLLLPYRKRYL